MVEWPGEIRYSYNSQKMEYSKIYITITSWIGSDSSMSVEQSRDKLISFWRIMR